MKWARGLFVLVLAGALAGCGAGSGNSEPSGASEAAGSPEASGGQASSAAAQESGEKRTIEHAMGSVTLEKPPERIVLLFNGAVDNAVALGVKPAGAVESWEEKPWYEFLRDKMEGVVNLGEETQPNIEAIVSLKPDLIIGAKSRHEKIYPQLSEIAPTLMTENVFDWKSNLKLGAQAMYKEKEAEQLLQEWDRKVSEFKEKTGSALGLKEVSLIRFESDGSARIYITGFAGTIFQELGLARPKSQQVEGKTVINLTSKEQMEQLDGDYIFDITRFTEGDESRQQTKDAWTTHPLWNSLKGVKAGHYYPVDVVTWNLSAGILAAQHLLDDLSKIVGSE